MSGDILGIHHITAIVGDPKTNIGFYAGVLGLRLVKKTVNYDDPETYHLYYGDERGAPGTIVSFFPWTSQAPKGRAGPGQVVSIAFAAPRGSLEYWLPRLRQAGFHPEGPSRLFEESYIGFSDPDGLSLQIVAFEDPRRTSAFASAVPPEYAIRGIHHAGICVSDPRPTVDFLTSVLGLRLKNESRERMRFAAEGESPGTMADVLPRPGDPRGLMGVGTVHHIAWRTADQEAQRTVRERLLGSRIQATPVIDRTYFHSVYYHEPGENLFEIATDPPGFTVDEPLEDLGSELKLPRWLEPRRAAIEKALPPLASGGGPDEGSLRRAG